MARKLVIVDYDPQWPTIFDKEKTRLLDAIGSYVTAIEHIGSTSVPNLGAKPVIDIMVGLRHLADAAHCIAPLENLGYVYVPDFEDAMPYRRYFRKTLPHDPHEHTHHIHMVETQHEFWSRHLLFRDYLRTHPDDAAAYEKLKRELAPQFTSGSEYADAKTEFITAIMAKAQA